MSVNCRKRAFRYRFNPETLGYTRVHTDNEVESSCQYISYKFFIRNSMFRASQFVSTVLIQY